MRASAAGGHSEGSYIQRAGGAQKASEALFRFYDHKFARKGAPLDQFHWEQLSQRHGLQPVKECTKTEIMASLKGVKHGVSAGLDGTTYEGFLQLLARDDRHRIPQYFTRLMRGEEPLPESWRKGRIVLLPKVSRPSEPKDLRPICLTPVLGRIFSKVLMKRVHLVAPPPSGHQIGCRKGVQVADGIMAAQSALQLLKHAKGRAFVAKLDIKAAFDSIDILAVHRWLLQAAPAKECEVLFHLLTNTQVELSLGGRMHSVGLGRGLMQGTSYSADVFSRVVDFFLAPLHDSFDLRHPEWNHPNLGLPHFIVYADDVLVLADTPQALQAKVQQLVDSLQAIGLVVNSDKTRVMSSHDDQSPGVWLRGSPFPLQVGSSLQFLGVPLSHSPQPHGIISYLLRRTSNSYYGFKRIMMAGAAPAHVRLLIFSTYITSKWSWAAPMMLPSKVALRRLEAAKTTYLLSLFRMPTDPLLPWVENVVSRRRAIKLLCRIGKGPDWRRTWLTRQWGYLGHLARTPHKQPMSRILQCCGGAQSGRSGVRVGWLVDLLIRRVQRVYATWPWAKEIPYWEDFAKDRIQWREYGKKWIDHWLQDPVLESPATLSYLFDRQLLILRTNDGVLDCILRPSKDFSEQPYLGAVHVIRPGVVRGPFVWGQAFGDHLVVVVADGRSPSRAFYVHSTAPSSTAQGISIGILRLAYKVQALLEVRGFSADVFLPSCLVRRTAFHGHVPLALLADATETLNLFDRQGACAAPCPYLDSRFCMVEALDRAVCFCCTHPLSTAYQGLL